MVLRGGHSVLRTMRPPMICEVLYRDRTAVQAPYQERVESLFELLKDFDYNVLRICKSACGSAVEKVVEVSRFPETIWTSENSDECDYLLCPIEQTESTWFSALSKLNP